MTRTHLNSFCLIVLSCCLFAGCGVNKHSSVVNNNPDAVAAKASQPIGEKLKENNHLPVEERIALYHRLKKENPDGYNFENRDELNMYGYSLLWSDLPKEALAIFKLNVEQFPDWFEGYDSLGEGYINNGDNEKAISNYERSLQLNAGNFNAEDQIERIKFPNKKPETFADKFNRVYTVQAYKDDLDELGRKLTEINPAALKFISKEDFWKTVEAKKALITEKTSFSQFYWHCKEIIASINCSHTYIDDFFRQADMPLALRFPLQTRLMDNRLFVIEANNENVVAVKDEILSINGMAVSTLIPDMYRHIQSQGYVETTKRHFFNRWSTAIIPYTLDFPEKYEIEVKGKEKPIQLNTAKTYKVQNEDPSVKQCKDGLCFEILKDQKTAILTVASFNYYPWNNLSVFKDFMDTRFKEIHEKGITNLIIDVRFNGGGSSESSIHLLKYLVDKPFTYYADTQIEKGSGKSEGEIPQAPFANAFKGKQYFIIDGNGKSTTGHFMGVVKVLKLGTIVGEELGSNQYCTAGQTIARLSNTKLNYFIADTGDETMATSLPDETGILPDHYVTQSIDEYLNNVDAVKEFTIKLVNK
ncbi:MAG: S41 family peptidase [Ferruginibacter sp.]